MDIDFNQPWYHGSPFVLTTLQAGSTITQDRDLARVFSHKPTIVAQNFDDAGSRSIKHTGTRTGYLYQIDEAIGADDVYPHPHSTMNDGQEWLIRRELKVSLLWPTVLRTEERLSEAELTQLKAKLEAQWTHQQNADN